MGDSLTAVEKRTVIIQGELHDRINLVVGGIRAWFAGELILSTWDRGTRPTIPGVDRVLLLEDPGPGPVQNIKRQIVGLKSALEMIDSEVVFKTRSDMIHRKDVFDFFRHQKGYESEFSIFSDRVVISSVMTMNHDSPPEYRPLSPSDWFYVGIRKDLERYCDVLKEVDTYGHLNMCCEQLWFLSAIKKYLNLGIDVTKIKDLNSIVKWKLLLNNFVVLNTNRVADAVCLRYRHNCDDNVIYVNEEVFAAKAKEVYGI
jgi:hypothetical protein